MAPKEKKRKNTNSKKRRGSNEKVSAEETARVAWAKKNLSKPPFPRFPSVIWISSRTLRKRTLVLGHRPS